MLHDTDNRRDLANVRVSVVLPVYNEAGVLIELTNQLTDVLESCVPNHELIYVNDGSTDESKQILNELAGHDSHIRVLHLSRNFGHQAALHAGLSRSSGDVVVVMDSDLQDDPAAIPEFLERWSDGYDVVYAIRTHRKENALKRFLSWGFYRLLNFVSDIWIPNDAGNFGLLDRRVAKHIIAIRDRNRFFPGLRSWVGFSQIGVPVERLARHDARPRVSMLGLWRLAKTAIFSFSKVPLSLFYFIAILSMVVGTALSVKILYDKLIAGRAIPGWASISLIGCFFGSLNALGIGILGEYVVRIYDEVRARPLFLIAETVNFDSESDCEADVQSTGERGWREHKLSFDSATDGSGEGSPSRSFGVRDFADTSGA